MMKNLLRILSVLAALMLCLPLACAQTGEAVVAMINGEALYASDYMAVESAFLYQYEMAGVDMADASNYAYVQDLALTYAMEQCLVRQDMKAHGCYDLTAEEEAWCLEMGKASWEKALADVGEMLRQILELPEGTDMSESALSYAASLGVTEQTYVEEYRTQLAMVKYESWLLGGEGVSDADVQAAYDARVSDSEAKYSSDVAAFENAMYTGAEVWYMPAGYRRVLQILLPAQGATDEERMASAAAQVAEINARLEAGESFQSLIQLYGADANFSDPAFYQTGYSVHRESIMWEDAFVAAAFAPEMAAPGCWSPAFASDLGVHILYYLEDVPGGAVPLTDEVRDTLASVIYDERTSEALADRIDVLAEEAVIVIY